MEDSNSNDGGNTDVATYIVENGGSLTPSSNDYARNRRKKLGAVLISGVGFLADAYDLFAIDFVVAILTATAASAPTAGEKGLIVSSTLAGAVVGQLVFGAAADYMGRRIMFMATAALVILGATTSSMVGFGYQTHHLAFPVFEQLALCRFFLGIGIGGEYPLSATIAAESEADDEPLESNMLDSNSVGDKKKRKSFLWYLSHKPNSVAAVFSMQGIGMLLSPLFVMFLISVGVSLEATWRLCVGVGAIPSTIAFFFRWRMHETAAFKKMQRDFSIAHSITSEATAARYCKKENSLSSIYTKGVSTLNGDDDDESKVYSSSTASLALPEPTTKHQNDRKEYHTKPRNLSSVSLFGKHLKHSFSVLKKYRYVLLGTSATWFLIDVTLYGNGSFKSSVVGNWFIENNNDQEKHIPFTAQTTNEPRRLFADEVWRPIEFPETKAQLQRDFLHKVLSNFNSVKKDKITLPAKKATPGFFNHDQHLIRSTTVEQQQQQHAEQKATFNYDHLAHYRHLSESVNNANSPNPLSKQEAKRRIMIEAQMSAIVALLAIPGYFLSLFLVDRTGLKPLQLWGFCAVAIVFFCLGLEQLFKLDIRALELILFGLTFLCSNFGPNTTTFILPAQLYPTVVRATCHGFSAAMGKLGGVVGTSFFSILQRDLGLGWLLIICGGVALLGALFTLLIPNDQEAKERLEQDEIELAIKKAKSVSSNNHKNTSFHHHCNANDTSFPLPNNTSKADRDDIRIIIQH